MRNLRPNLGKESGFGLTVFVVIIAVIAFSIFLTTSAIYIKKHINEKTQKEQQYVSDLSNEIRAFWIKGGFAYDNIAVGAVTSAMLLNSSGISVKYNANIDVSNPILSPEGIVHRRVAIWLPSELSADNPPDIAKFKSTGEFSPCTNKGGADGIACDELKYTVFDSLDVEKEMVKQTSDKLQRVALKAQAFFQARLYQDPDRDISINRFLPYRSDFGFNTATMSCTGVSDPDDLDCLESPTPLASILNGTVSVSKSATVLSLSNDELVSAWGTPLKAENLILTGVASDTGKPCSQVPGNPEPPYCMIFSADTPFGTTISVTAVQQL